MRPLLIGSAALAYHLDKMEIAHNIVPKDYDLIVQDEYDAKGISSVIQENAIETTPLVSITSKKFNTHTKAFKCDGVIFEITHPLDYTDDTSTSNLLLLSSYWKEYTTINGVICKVAPLDVLFMLKWSHRYLKNSPHFRKTMVTIRNLQKIGAKVYDEEWLKLREKETYDYSHPKLNVSKSDFFNSNFAYVYDHDSIHNAVKVLDRPAYMYYMEYDQEVKSSREKFFAQPREIQLLGVLEEAYVLAIERVLIPNNFNVKPRQAFDMALEKVCTSITSGWFRQFAWENYELVSRMYDGIYVDKFILARDSDKLIMHMDDQL
ncbi:hypothetical protein ZZ1p0078 [Acinetobacter phage ZZ1]|uniref:Uncharacterized protein n=1 Tax=Acinetobacter phage ZZ1 TaxID=1049283 RepID=I3WVL5_9CAUD|nr:hypothetical protein ZZ1p0078 [Acinetobacter phage ZZ1]AFL47535.1 hypothetical protein ZZ1p0078 [Acinetobacter phage ZZ1]